MSGTENHGGSKSIQLISEYFLERFASQHSCILNHDGDFCVRPVSSTNAKCKAVLFFQNEEKVPSNFENFDNCFIVLPETTNVEIPNGIGSVKVKNPRAVYFDMVRSVFANSTVGFVEATAVVHPSSILGENVRIHSGVVIGENCVIGENTEIRSGVNIHHNVKIGRNCLIKGNSIIGEEGFGVYKDEQGNNQLIPHTGGVVIADNVVVGAICTICSGTLDPTIIEENTMIDDHVHIAHNCEIGRNTIITACAELSGSISVGSNVWIGPQAAIMNKISIGDNAYIGLAAVVRKSVLENAVVAGNPAKVLRYQD